MRLDPEWRKKIGTGLLLFGVGWVLFLLFLTLTFPTDKGKLLIQQYGSYYFGRDLTIETMEVSLPLRASLREARFRGGRGEPDLVVDRLSVSLSPLSLIFSPYKISGSASIWDGEVRFLGWMIRSGSEQLDLEFSGRELDLRRIPLKEGILPVRFLGRLDFSGDLAGLGENVKSWRGRLALSVREGGFEMDPAFSAPVPSLTFDRLEGEAILQKGLVTAQNLVLTGGDVDAVLEGRIMLENPIGLSRVTALFRFRIPSKEKALRLEPVLGLLRRDPEGYYNVPIQGSFAEFGGNFRAFQLFAKTRDAR
jgi:type II secretion system protein N